MFAKYQLYGVNITKGSFLFAAIVLSASAISNAHARAITTTVTPLSVSSQPSNTTIYEGQSTTFTLNATSSKTIKYTWYKDGAVIGTNSKNFSISAATPGNAGTYGCKATDGTTTYTCTNFSLNVNLIVRITQQPTNQIVNQSASATMSVAATGTAPLAYQWYLGGAAVTGATASSITIASAQPINSGIYYCIVTNPGSSATSSSATLSVLATTPTSTASVRWSAPTTRIDGSPLAATDIAGYNLYESENDPSLMYKIASLSSADLSYQVTGLAVGAHYFSATAVDFNGVESALASPVTVTIQ